MLIKKNLMAHITEMMGSHKFISSKFIFVVFCCIMSFMTTTIFAQESQMVQVKTLNQQLEPIKNINISINNGAFISMGPQGHAFVELGASDIPVKSIHIKDKQLEAASWNHSKGILEVIIRRKSYRVITLTVKNKSNALLTNEMITFNGKKAITGKINGEGQVSLPVPLNDTIISAQQLSIAGHKVLDVQETKGTHVVIVEPVVSSSVENIKADNQKNTIATAPRDHYFKDFKLSDLDSIQSLTVFYAIFKNFNIEDLDEEAKRQVDSKFNELVGELQDSIRNSTVELSFLNRISDSTFMRDDLENLLAQARMESQMLLVQQAEFDQKIEMINDKLEAGFENLDDDARAKLLSNLNLLEKILTENENRFYKNQNNYRQIIENLKERFFNLEALEEQLSASEAQRLEEQRIFQRRLLATLSIVALFAILIILLIYFSNKLKKQKEALVLANAEIKRINENLEGIVAHRTRLLAETNKELDTVLYRASHDLRSPVRSILGLCNIATTLSNGATKEVLDKLVETTVGMDKLLKKLSVISEINEPSNFSPVVMAKAVQTVQNDFKEIIQDNKIKFVIDCPADLIIHSYPNLIEIILTNLIENALFYCMIKNIAKPKVQLTATMKGDDLELVLTDNGVGVDDTISDKLFDMFFKGTEKSTGNGLGLYIVQKSVHALNGNITVESEPGKFARFVIQLPLKDLQREPVQESR